MFYKVFMIFTRPDTAPDVKSSGRLFKILWPFQNVQALFHSRIIQNLTKPIVAFLLSYAHTRNKF